MPLEVQKKKALERNRKWQKKQGKYFQEKYQKKYREKTLHRTLWMTAKKRATHKGYDFSIESKDVKIPKICPILKIPLIKGKNKVHSNSPSLDRIDTTKGYIKGNVRVISWKANKYKSDMKKKDIKSLYKYVFGL